jgi:ATP-dependent RNA helicase DeaD
VHDLRSPSRIPSGSKDVPAENVTPPNDIAFAELGLSEQVLKALADVGYESPSPIQAATIPPLLAGKDVLGQAQTGTGKTAAFALPILSKLDLRLKTPQALVLCPTRELAIQVAEAFQKYAAHMPGFHVLPIYGGQSYTPQLTSLKRGVHVVVGTPGRVMDHLKRNTLDLSKLTNMVLDEADEMLQMGFIDDVDWILEQTPAQRQVALFSATMPAQIRRICQKHLKSPAEITIRGKTSTANNIRQRYWIVGGMHHKLEALTRILESETFDAMIVFARTKQATVELAEKLGARGFSVEALNGDIQQNVRERTIARLKNGQIDIIVATDVAARGLDVERVSHVINYDVPYDSESYVHRIGRTGRAGRSGDAILFIAPRERNMLGVIERATRQPIEAMQMPTVEAVNQQRIAKFKEKIAAAIASGEAKRFRFIVEQMEQEGESSALDIAAALVVMAQGKSPLLLENGRSNSPANDKGWTPTPSARGNDRGSDRGNERGNDRGSERAPRPARFERDSREERAPRAPMPEREPRMERAPKPAPQRPEVPRAEFQRPEPQRPAPIQAEPELHFDSDADEIGSDTLPSLFDDAPAQQESSAPRGRSDDRDDIKRETYRIEVGHTHGIKAGNIVGAIANEAGLEGKFIGRVDIREDHSFVDLPEGMPKQIFRDLQKTRVGGQELRISRADAPPPKHAHFKSYKADRPSSGSDRPRTFAKPQGFRSTGDRPSGDRPSGDRPTGDRPPRAHKAHGMNKGSRPPRPR